MINKKIIIGITGSTGVLGSILLRKLKKKLHMDLFVKNIKSKIFPLYND
jgi:3-polyprenyl-4-hydroxybenzoate decarboxylase